MHAYFSSAKNAIVSHSDVELRILISLYASGVTESLFCGAKGGADLRLGMPRGRHRKEFFYITFIVHKWGGGGQ